MRKLNKTLTEHLKEHSVSQCLAQRTDSRGVAAGCWTVQMEVFLTPSSSKSSHFFFFAWCLSKREKKEKREAAEEAWRVIKSSKKRFLKNAANININREDEVVHISSWSKRVAL